MPKLSRSLILSYDNEDTDLFVLSREKMLVTPLGILYGGLLLLGLVAALLYCLHIAQWGKTLYESRFRFNMT